MSILSTNLSYAPVPPSPGEYLIKIVRYFEDHTYIFLDFDIAVGPSTGFAHIAFQRTGKWPLRWRICKSTGKSVIQHALAAINEYPPTIATLSDSVGRNICVKIGFSDTAHQYYQVCRSYPASHYVIRKSDILIGTRHGQQAILIMSVPTTLPISRGCLFSWLMSMRPVPPWLIGAQIIKSVCSPKSLPLGITALQAAI